MELPAEAAVVRGAPITQKGIVKALEQARGKGAGNVLSVRADLSCTEDGPGLTPVELCEGLPHATVAWSTAGALAAAGIKLRHTPSFAHFAHFSAELADPVEESITTFVGCFSKPEPNPTGGKKKRRSQ